MLWPESGSYFQFVKDCQQNLIRTTWLPELREAVIDRLQEGWSPEQIAGRLKLEGHAMTVSHETIYAYVYSPDGQSQALARYLPERRKKRKPRYARTPRGMMFPLNGTPRKCLGWQTPTEAFAEELRKLR